MKLGNYCELKVSDTLVVPIQFGMGAVEIFCELHGVDLDYFDEVFAEDSTIKQIKYLQIIKRIIYAGAAFAAQDAGKPVTFTEHTVSGWLDSLGWFGSPNVKEVVNVFIQTLYPGVETTEKQGEVQGKTQEAVPESANP